MKFQWFFIIVNSVNKDINIVAGTLPVCKECGSYLSNYTITPEERKCRRKERSLYWDNCNQIIYAVLIQTVINFITFKRDNEIHNLTINLYEKIKLGNNDCY